MGRSRSLWKFIRIEEERKKRIRILVRAESDRCRLLMEADNALEKRLAVYVQVSQALTATIYGIGLIINSLGWLSHRIGGLHDQAAVGAG
jgi:hypothetical protein